MQKKISKVELTFDRVLLQQYVGNLNESNSLFVDVIKVADQTSKITLANNVKILLSAGRNKNGFELKNTIKLIRYMVNVTKEEESPIKSMRVTYKYLGFKTKTVDIVVDGIKYFELDLSGDSEEYIGDNICYHYYNNPANYLKDDYEPNLKDIVFNTDYL